VSQTVIIYLFKNIRNRRKKGRNLTTIWVSQLLLRGRPEDYKKNKGNSSALELRTVLIWGVVLCLGFIGLYISASSDWVLWTEWRISWTHKIWNLRKFIFSGVYRQGQKAATLSKIKKNVGITTHVDIDIFVPRKKIQLGVCPFGVLEHISVSCCSRALL
jgi:hypothetical protein